MRRSLTPKPFSRVRRFQQALTGIKARRAVDWMEVACTAGYYDQVRFAHDFKAFSGLTPSEYLTRSNDEVNFVPDHQVKFFQYRMLPFEHHQRIMNTLKTLLILLATLLSSVVVHAAEKLALDEHLEPIRPFLGKTWRGEFKNSRPDKPTVDVARWERALNGKAVRVLHSVNNGSYGGESIIRWDKESKQVVYHYFTTAGFMTSGTMSVADGKLVGLEKVSGDANGVTEVRSTTELRPDGTMLVKAEYLKDGQPAGGRETLYKEDPLAEVKFK